MRILVRLPIGFRTERLSKVKANDADAPQQPKREGRVKETDKAGLLNQQEKR